MNDSIDLKFVGLLKRDSNYKLKSQSRIKLQINQPIFR